MSRLNRMKFNSYTSSFHLVKLTILGIFFLNSMVASHEINKRELIKPITEINPTRLNELIKDSDQSLKFKAYQEINEECNCKRFSKRNLKLKKRMSCLMCGDINTQIKGEGFESLPFKNSPSLIVVTSKEKSDWRKKSLRRIQSLRIKGILNIFDSRNPSTRRLIERPPLAPPTTQPTITINDSPENLSFRDSFNVNQFEDHQYPNIARSYSDSFTFDI